ncbi:PucR family transcriptional regulator [Pseudonocardia asaccharolytica]|uniref:PucR family transcriptional regulator n=1 Tax=Pseudonocardia asaccharolytica DSM 44247 = NBRC 16224 TaxID=1123024 RepID=A0A511CXS9_9PSEU|nr:PucR family transcriptional regulator [Pseudonocardia asaccharolytica]GEL17361.1 PucR family transcriptional regulator [Pseudonocardia asaccharolytica DSM 44247 = NBRC 16224]
MPATLCSLVEDRTLGLLPACPREWLDRPISWVHISELADPTTYLDGGELLLTTGLGLGADTDHDAFVRRLVERGVAGLGFGTGLSHAVVPAALREATRAHGLPLLEIPERTPFIAISKAVSAALAADAYAEVVRTDEAQRALTAAALEPHAPVRVLRTLARRLDAWVLLLDASGAAVHAVGCAADEHLAELADEVDRVCRHRGPTSVTVTGRGGQVVLQPLRLHGRGVLATGRPHGFAPADMQIIGSAVSLLTLLHAGPSSVTAVRRDLHAALLRMVLAGRAEAARSIVAGLSEQLPPAPLHVVALAGPAQARRELLEGCEARGPDRPPLFVAALGDTLVALVPAGDAADAGALGWLTAQAGQQPGLGVGISNPVGDDAAGHGHRQACQAAEAALRAGAPVVRFAELAGTALLDLVRPVEAAAFAEALLAPLARHDARHRGQLIRSMREWLAQHGQWEPAAARLGVHRHTLRKRMRRVEELTGRSLDSPGFRAELWLALQLTGDR